MLSCYSIAWLDFAHQCKIQFNTVAGLSKCTHEEGTAAIEVPNISIESLPGITPVDEVMIFKIGLNNEVCLFICHVMQLELRAFLTLIDSRAMALQPFPSIMIPLIMEMD